MMLQRLAQKWLWILMTFALCGLFFIAILPRLLGSKWLIDPIVARFRADDFLLEIDSIELRWFSPLRVLGVRMHQEDGTELLTIREISTNRGLFGFLTGGRDFGRVDIYEPTVDVQLVSNETNLGRFVKAVQGDSQAGSQVTNQRPEAKLLVAVHEFSTKVQREDQALPLVIVPPFDLTLRYACEAEQASLNVGATQILKEVELTPELLEFGLAYAVPLLAKSAWFDGKISLATDDLFIDLTAPQKSTGNASITLHQVRSGPTQPQIVKLLALYATMRGREPLQEIVFVDGSVVLVGMRDEKISHSGLNFGLPKTDPRFQISTAGDVGIVDKKLNLALDFPVPIEQLARRDSVQALGVPKITLPISGTLDSPEIDWLAFRGDSAILLGQIREAVQDESPGVANVIATLESLSNGDADQTIAAAADFAKQLIERRRQRREQSTIDNENSELNNSASETESPESSRPIRDALRGILRPRP